MTLLRTLALTTAFLILTFGAWGLVDKIDQDADARADYQRWVSESCLPLMTGEFAVIIRDGKEMRCRIFSNIAYDQAPRLVSAAVMEAPR